MPARNWEIHIPESGVSALSEWPKNKKSRNSVKQWLQEQNHGNPDDLIDGACEPLAYHLSSKMSQNHWIIGLRNQYREIKDQLEELDPQQVAANVIFGEYVQHKIPSTTYTVLGSTDVRTCLQALSVRTLAQ